MFLLCASFFQVAAKHLAELEQTRHVERGPSWQEKLLEDLDREFEKVQTRVRSSQMRTMIQVRSQMEYLQLC